MLLIQIANFAAAGAFFKAVFSEKTTALIGTVLWATCPYWIYICYDVPNPGRAAGWTLAMVYAWAASKLWQGHKKLLFYLAATASIAGIAYVDVILFVIVVMLSLVYSGLAKKPAVLLSVIGGCGIAAPAMIYILQYLIGGNTQLQNLPIQSITMKGYTPGQLLSLFTYAPNLPGIGLGLFGAAAILCRQRFAGELSLKENGLRWMGVTAIGMFFCATVYFPWDFIQRVAVVFLRFVSLIELPNVFMGVGCFFLCVPSAYAVGQLREEQNKFLRYGVPAVVMIAAVGTAIWLGTERIR